MGSIFENAILAQYWMPLQKANKWLFNMIFNKIHSYLLHGLFTMAAEIFWSMKKSSERANPMPIAAMEAVHGSFSTGARTSGKLTL